MTQKKQIKKVREQRRYTSYIYKNEESRFFFFLHFHTRYSQDATTVVFGHIAFFSAPAPAALEQ